MGSYIVMVTDNGRDSGRGVTHCRVEWCNTSTLEEAYAAAAAVAAGLIRTIGHTDVLIYIDIEGAAK